MTFPTSALSGAGDDEAVAPVLGGAAVTADVVGEMERRMERAALCTYGRPHFGEDDGDYHSLDWVVAADIQAEANHLGCGPHRLMEREIITTAWREVPPLCNCEREPSGITGENSGHCPVHPLPGCPNPACGETWIKAFHGDRCDSCGWTAP